MGKLLKDLIAVRTKSELKGGNKLFENQYELVKDRSTIKAGHKKGMQYVTQYTTSVVSTAE